MKSIIILALFLISVHPHDLSASEKTLPGEYLAISNEDLSEQEMSSRLEDFRLELAVEKFKGSQKSFYLKEVQGKEIAHLLKKTGLFEVVEENQVVSRKNIFLDSFAKKLPNDPAMNKAWALERVGAPEAWNIRTDSDDVIVAVLDSGVDLSHPDLKDNLWVNKREITGNGKDDDHNGYVDDIHGIDSHNQTSNPQDKVGHGTLIAGIIGARGNNGVGGTGVLWRTKIMAIAGERGDGVMSFAGVIKGGYYAAEMGAKVINGSWGTYTPVATVKKMLEDIAGYGVILVNAVSNNTNDIDRQILEYPAAYRLPNVITVTATNKSDELVHYASFGKKYVDIAAPGWAVLTTELGGGTTMRAGTSIAAPFVTAAVAMVMAEHPHLDYREVKARILGSVDRLPSLRDKVVSGGRLNIARALR